MFHFIVTIISEILMSIKFEGVLYFASLIVTLFLISSPGAIATTIGVCAKLGIADYVYTKKKEAE